MNTSKAAINDRICKEFEDVWSAAVKPDFEYFLKEVAMEERGQMLERLLSLDFDLQIESGQTVNVEDYRILGDRAKSFVARRLKEHLANNSIDTTKGQNLTLRTQDAKTGVDPFLTEDFGADRTNSNVDLENLPERIGRYRIERVLGKGGFGLVYLACDDQLDRQVAIKVPHAKLVSRQEDAASYLEEARTVANLDHPNIVPVYDVGETDEFPCYIVSRYIKGMDLAAKCSLSRMEPSQAANLVATIADALHFAHGQGLVHRDIKPGNILLDISGNPYVVDFGLALKERDLGKGPGFAGTPAYMSPEQARGEGHRVDGRSDIYSLGAVFYELLVGRRTFEASSTSQMLQQIANQDVKPPRQIDDQIPKELERICLKAISRRSNDRYTTALDMAGDLKHFLEKNPASLLSTREIDLPLHAVNLDSTKAEAQSNSTNFESESQQLRIVPKGLRSFGAHDADFFLELLPGPRDRDGIPDTLRYWKLRIEETDSDETFAVGLIYGPSGCGKSSFVKAGLLPRLNDDVVRVYIESTPDETESRILNGLRKSCPDLDTSLSLAQSLASLRQGHGIASEQKVLIVLDQFEQWLHGKNESENAELVKALRQCDGTRVQCILMVRDDFWMALTRFLRELEVKLVEDHNLAAVDLFPARHAQKVLKAFGRAFGALPEDANKITKEQNEFLEQSVAGLAQDGKVICVRLALFAEMMKGKPWTASVLREVGGTKGIGSTFLEETFSSSTASPGHRYHQKPARAVLKALLPVSGTDIKGEMKSYDELLAASGYVSRPKDFDDLIRILDSEIRLITPTDPEGVDHESNSASTIEVGQKYYQLTHDYLVPSLRNWLTSKQKETRRGRAELRFAERSDLWNAKPENRRLPSWWENINFHLLTNRQQWTVGQRKMMRHASWTHAAQIIAGILCVTALAVLINAQSETPARTFADSKDPAARMNAFRQLDLDEKVDFELLKTTLGKESNYQFIKDVLSEKGFKKKTRDIAVLPPTERQEFLLLMQELVLRKPILPETEESLLLLDEIRTIAFGEYCDLSSTKQVLSLIQEFVRSERESPTALKKMCNYIGRTERDGFNDVADQLAEVFTDNATFPEEMRISALRPWSTLPEEEFRRHFEYLVKRTDEVEPGVHQKYTTQMFRRLIELKENDSDELVRATFDFLDLFPADALSEYFYVASDNLEETANNLVRYAKTSRERTAKIAETIEQELIELARQTPAGNVEIAWSDKYGFLVRCIGELGTLENKSEKSLVIIGEILQDGELAKENGWSLNELIRSFANLKSLQPEKEMPEAMETIRRVLADSKTYNNVRAEYRARDDRTAAAKALEQLGDLKSKSVARNVFASNNELEIRIAALQLYGALASPIDVEYLKPQLLETKVSLTALLAIHSIIINAGDEAHIVVEKLLPFLVDKHSDLSKSLRPNHLPYQILVNKEIAHQFPQPQSAILKSTKSVAVALARATALNPAEEQRVFAGKCLDQMSDLFRPNISAEIHAMEDSKTRKLELENWNRWWNSQSDLQLTSSD